MKILLIQPPKLLKLKSSRGTLPVSLLYIASSLRKSGHIPSILDLSVLQVPDGIDLENYHLTCVSERAKALNIKNTI